MALSSGCLNARAWLHASLPQAGNVERFDWRRQTLLPRAPVLEAAVHVKCLDAGCSYHGMLSWFKKIKEGWQPSCDSSFRPPSGPLAPAGGLSGDSQSLALAHCELSGACALLAAAPTKPRNTHAVSLNVRSGEKTGPTLPTRPVGSCELL